MQEAGIPRKLAPTIGIAVDHRRRNLSTESLTANVARLKSYQARLILFPRRNGQHKKTDASPEDVKGAKSGEGIVRSIGGLLPIKNITTKEGAVTEIKRSEITQGEDSAYRKLRVARSDARLVGVREKRAKAKAEEAQAQKK